MIIKIMFLMILWNLIVLLLNKNKRCNVLYCGLVGFSGSDNFNLDKIKLLLFWNSIERLSKDSTGVYTPKTGLCRSTEAASKFISNNKINIIEDTLLIGHVRSKSVGSISINNTHPFKFGNLIGAHNGTITNEYPLCTSSELNWRDYKVDSQIIFARLNKDRNPKVLCELEGSAAIIFYIDEEKSINKLYVFRNSERPLFRGLINGNMYISSSEASLEAIECKSIVEFSENYLYTIKEGKIIDHIKLKVHKSDKTKILRFMKGANSDNSIINKWACLQYNIMIDNKEFKKGNWFFIDSFADNLGNKVNGKIIKTDKEIISLYATNFDTDSYTFKKGTICRATTDIYVKGKDKELFCYKGERVIVNVLYTDDTVDISCALTKDTFETDQCKRINISCSELKVVMPNDMFDTDLAIIKNESDYVDTVTYEEIPNENLHKEFDINDFELKESLNVLKTKILNVKSAINNSLLKNAVQELDEMEEDTNLFLEQLNY